ncbi:MAG: hypothetical protein K2G82_04480, partial [Paramuribaculum sp.]|nr:hypothetical protein [Paramuribaculum sp.]
ISLCGVTGGDQRYNSAVFSLSDVRFCKDNDKITYLSKQSLHFFTHGRYFTPFVNIFIRFRVILTFSAMPT